VFQEKKKPGSVDATSCKKNGGCNTETKALILTEKKHAYGTRVHGLLHQS
jgi:hypothetical protein